MDPREERLRRLVGELQNTSAETDSLIGIKALLLGAVYSLSKVCELSPGESGCDPFYKDLKESVKDGLDELQRQAWPASRSPLKD